MKEEFDSLIHNPTWELVQLQAEIDKRKRLGKAPLKIIGSRWVYKKKQNANGEMERYEARLVAQGFTQRFGIDYEQTNALVVAMSTLRMILSIGSSNGWIMEVDDVKCTYLNGTL